MSYQVIARKYRPQRFAEVVGQEHVTQTLANAIRQNRIAHAYLFCGPRGTGKTTVARIFAKCLNCTDGPKVDFDDADPRCVEITEGRALDVLEIDGASNNGVEQVRELRETVKYAPAAARFKIYIIDEVHMLSTAAFNALLKTLEEPPAHVKFMFATTDPEKVLPTILSRCQRFDLRRIPANLIVQHLARIAEQEGVRIDEPALHAIARGADGGMRDAESTLDQLISFCGTEIAEGDVLSMFGLAARSQILALAGTVIAGDTAGTLQELDELTRHGKDLGRLLSDLLNHFRNLLIFQVAKGDLRLLEVSEAEAGALREQSAQLDAEAVGRIMEVLAEGEGRLRDATSRKILIEVTLLRAIQARSAVSVEVLLKRLNELRGETAEPAPATREVPTSPASPARSRAVIQRAGPAATAAAAPAPAPAAPAVVADTPEALTALWAQLLEAVGRASPFARGYLSNAFAVAFERGTLTIGFPPEFADQIILVDSPKNQVLIQAGLRELGQGEAQVKFVRASAPAAPPVAPPPPAPTKPAAPQATPPAAPPPAKLEKPKPEKLDPADFKDDPLIKQALEIFRGRIVEVRR
jgi:DNA polymerase-3 subunit gamma/tau